MPNYYLYFCHVWCLPKYCSAICPSPTGPDTRWLTFTTSVAICWVHTQLIQVLIWNNMLIKIEVDNINENYLVKLVLQDEIAAGKQITANVLIMTQTTSLRYWTGVWAVVHVEIVRNGIDILSCVLHSFMYNFESIYIGYWKIYVKRNLTSKQIIKTVIIKTILRRNIFHCLKLFSDWVPFMIIIVYLYIWTPACPLYY